MKTYTSRQFFIDDMGTVPSFSGLSDNSIETKEEQLLWHINSMRDHDRLPRLTELPYGVSFELEH